MAVIAIKWLVNSADGVNAQMVKSSCNVSLDFQIPLKCNIPEGKSEKKINKLKGYSAGPLWFCWNFHSCSDLNKS